MQARRPVDFLRVNGLIGDPAIFAFFQRTGDAVLFDLGALDNLSNRELLRVRMALVSHTHIDHFIGFDRLLRVNIPHGRELQLVGPPGLTLNVQGKLRGYLWNLLEPAQLRFVVHEVSPAGEVTSARLTSDDGFAVVRLDGPTKKGEGVEPPSAPCASVPAPFDDVRFDCVALDHKSPSIAFACQLPTRFHVNEAALDAAGMLPGPWIRDAQIALGDGKPETPVTVGGKTHTAGELGQLAFERRSPRPLGYVTDAGFTPSNVERATKLLKGVETLICETNYRDSEATRALDRMHLTTRHAALLAALAGARELAIFHVSNIYADDPAAVEAEAAGLFAEFTAMSQSQLAAAVAAEHRRLGL